MPSSTCAVWFFKGSLIPMPRLKAKLPKYCRFSGRNVACYWLNGQRVILPGEFNSPESLEAYHREMANLSQERASGKQHQTAHRKVNQLSIKEMVDTFLEWGKTHYLKNGQPNRTTEDFERSSRMLVDLFGNLPVEKFSQREMIVVQDSLVKNGLARRTVNDYVSRSKRIFNWAVGRGIISHDVAGRLKFVEPLKAGRTIAPERPKRQAVSDAIVEQTLLHLSLVVQDMVQIVGHFWLNQKLKNVRCLHISWP
jgi:hypothetical protein